MTNINELLSKMSLKDKISLCSGKNFWETKAFPAYNIPSIFMSDGPHGLRKQEIGKGTDMLGINESLPATCFPAEVTTGSSWDVELLQRIGSAIGKEALHLQIALVLGPGANSKRNPLCGRNFEYFSEDPYVTGKMAAAFIQGLESQGVGSSLKHFACNSQEEHRFISDSIIDERTLREIYLTGFEIAVKEGKPSSVMCAYPKLNGTHCSDNKKLLTEILRNEWGFDGFVVTDWGAINDRIKAFEAGCDLNMPGGSAFMEKKAFKLVKNGNLSPQYINESARRILSFVLRAKVSLKKPAPDCLEENHKLAVEAAVKGAVLLKNEDTILPVNPSKEKIAVIGLFAKQMRYQGAGSSHINAAKLSQPIDYFGDCAYAQGYDEKGNTDLAMLEDVEKTAQKADKVIVFAGLPANYESEGFDRETLCMPQGHNQVIETAVKANKNVVVVLFCGSAVECPWAGSVKGILYMGLPGQGGGQAAYSLLTGIANPSGRLTETWPLTYKDVPSSHIYDKSKNALYQEGIYIGYRYYEKAGIPVQWSFGFGLSYTSFEYSNLKINGRTVTVDVKNTGSVSGQEAVLLYVGKPQKGIHRPVRELKRFCKLSLEPGETKTASFTLDDRSFAIWDNAWIIEDGEYTISVGPLQGKITVPGTVLNKLEDNWYKSCLGFADFDSFKSQSGLFYAPEAPVKKGSFTMNSTIDEMKDYSPLMKFLYKVIEKFLSKAIGSKIDYSNPEFKMMMKASTGGPLRTLITMGGVPEPIVKFLLKLVNGK